MNTIQTIQTIIITAVVSGMATFIFTIFWSRGAFKTIVKEAVKNHEVQWHQETVKMIIDEHESKCPANQRFDKLEKAVFFLFIKAGGNINELGAK